jgi:ribonuclease D
LIATAACDRSPIHRPEPLDNKQQRSLKEMRSAVQARAKSLDVDPALLASRRELEKLLRAVDAGEPTPERFLGWRQDVITDELLKIIG